jgi:probable addiction module antidote protein
MSSSTVSVSHDEALLEELRADPEFAAEYLNAALEEDSEPAVLLIALRRVVEAAGGMATVAQSAGVTRESLYRALSPTGNPTLRTLAAVLQATGLRLAVARKPARSRAKRRRTRA